MDKIVKEEIVDWIIKPGNEDLLETLKLIKEASGSKDWYNDLQEHEKKSIEKGQKDHRRGHTLSSKEFWKKNAQ